MSLLGFDALYRFADQLPRSLAVVAAGGADRTVLESLSIAQRRGWVEPILTGPLDEMLALAKDLEIDLTEFRLIDSADPATAAVAEVKSGRAKLLMKGQIATPLLMKAILARETGLRTDRCIAQVVLMEITRDARRFLLSDTGITIQPTLEQKVDIVRSMVDVAVALSNDHRITAPRIGIMSATEKATESMPDTLEAQVPNLILQPLVENAIHHGVEPHARPGQIELRARRENDNLRLEVTDNGTGLRDSKSSGTGIGLSNTRARLQQLYGTAHQLEFQNGTSGGLMVGVTIPFRTGPNGAAREAGGK